MSVSNFTGGGGFENTPSAVPEAKGPVLLGLNMLNLFKHQDIIRSRIELLDEFTKNACLPSLAYQDRYTSILKKSRDSKITLRPLFSIVFKTTLNAGNTNFYRIREEGGSGRPPPPPPPPPFIALKHIIRRFIALKHTR